MTLRQLLPIEVPVEPDAEEARQWLITELSKPEYEAARPTLFDRIAAAFFEWLGSIFNFGPGFGIPGLLPIILTIVVLVALIVAFLVFGVPRLNRRSAAQHGTLFGENDNRNAAALRLAAQAAAARGDFTTAITEMFRCIARGLSERTIVTTFPGTTATGFAAQAGSAFPNSASELVAAASTFNDVRYLGGEGTAETFGAIAELERSLRGARSHVEVGAP